MGEARLSVVPMVLFLNWEDKTIGIIGAGNLGMAIIDALYSRGHKKLIATRRNEEELSKIKEKYSGIKTGNNNCWAVQESEIVILGVKPKLLEEVATEIKANLSEQLVLSMAAGKHLEQINAYLNGYNKVARIMTGISTAEEMAFYCCDKGCTWKDEQAIKYIFGKSAVKVEENCLDGRTFIACDAGILPMEVEAKIKALAENGLDEKLVRKAYGTMLMAVGKQLLEGKSGEELFDAVTGNRNEAAFTYRLYQHLEKQGHFQQLRECVEMTLKALKG